jgi:hypothetical protein
MGELEVISIAFHNHRDVRMDPRRTPAVLCALLVRLVRQLSSLEVVAEDGEGRNGWFHDVKWQTDNIIIRKVKKIISNLQFSQNN